MIVADHNPQSGYEPIVNKIIEVAGIQSGMIIGNVGAGRGNITLLLAEILGNETKIYANDILKSELDRLSQKAKEKGLKNIEIVLGSIEDPLFPVNNLDMILMTNMVHDLENPLGLIETLKKYLKPNGKLVIQEGLVSNDSFPTHEMTEKQFFNLFERTSFFLEKSNVSEQASIFVFQLSKEKAKNVWKNWLNDLKSKINEVKSKESNENLSEIKKRIMRERLLYNFPDYRVNQWDCQKRWQNQFPLPPALFSHRERRRSRRAVP